MKRTQSSEFTTKRDERHAQVPMRVTEASAGSKTVRGFTLIELLVVVSIIGLLSSVVLVSLNTARTKAYDAQRLANLRNIQTALEIYYTANGRYPDTNGNLNGECDIGGNVSPQNIIPGLVPTYLPKFPTDPRMNTTSNQCCYLYRGSGTDFKIMLGLSCPSPSSYVCPPSSPSSPFYDANRGQACSIFTSGGATF